MGLRVSHDDFSESTPTSDAMGGALASHIWEWLKNHRLHPQHFTNGFHGTPYAPRTSSAGQMSGVTARQRRASGS